MIDRRIAPLILSVAFLSALSGFLFGAYRDSDSNPNFQCYVLPASKCK